MIAGGRSNITVQMTDADGCRFVLRRPPLHGVLPTAHDMAREHRIIHALAPDPGAHTGGAGALHGSVR